MNLLSPWFLAGAALIAGPIIFHLIRRATKDRVQFSATQFLRESPPRLERKSRIQNPWLLALRCLVVLLLATAFARPFFQSDVPILSTATPPKSLVIALDNSASMRGADLWQNAKRTALEQAQALDPLDRLALVTVSQPPRTAISFERWKEWPPNERITLFENLLDRLEPTWQATRLDEGLDLAVAEIEQLSESNVESMEKRIALVSDFQKSASIAGLAGREWPEGCELELLTIESANSGNSGLRWLGWTEDESGESSIRVGIRSTGEIATGEQQLSLIDAKTRQPVSDPISLYLNSGDNRIVRLPAPKDHSGPFIARLEGDPEAFDNSLYIVKDEPRSLAIDYLGKAESPDDPDQGAFYLKKASAGWEDPQVEFHSESSPVSTSPASTIIVIDQFLNRQEAMETRSRIESGSNALFLLSSPDSADTLNALLEEEGWGSKPIDRPDSRLGSIDFRHRNFDLFADPRFSDFSKIRFWHDFALTEPNETKALSIARYDDGSPAVMEAEIGRGSLAVWVGDWSPRASQWVLSTKFVPWLQRLFERAVGGPEQPFALEMDGIAQSISLNNAKWKAMDSDTYSEAAPRAPGVYQLLEDRTERWIALNAPSSESDWDPRPIEDWERLGAPLSGLFTTESASDEDEEASRRLENAMELESQQQLWRWLIIIVAIVLAAESVIAKRLQNREEGIAA